MLILGVDPGVTTGAASLTVTNGKLTADAFQSTDVHAVHDWLDRKLISDGDDDIHIVVEEFTGGGYRTKESNHTLKVIGFFYYFFEEFATVVMRTNQQRLKGTSFVTPFVDVLPGPHGLDALKHCYSYLDEV